MSTTLVSLQVDRLTENSLLALPNFIANNVLGMVLVFLGMWVGRIR